MTTLLALFLTFFAPLQAQTVLFKQKISVPTKLEFGEILDPSKSELKPSEKLRSLQGKRVRITGFVAQMEEQPDNYFYLCSRPVYCDESGGGIGDLPVDAVRIVIRHQPKFNSPVLPIEVTGILELGGQSDLEQDSWAVRLLAENFKEISQPSKHSAQKQPHKPKQ